MFGWASRAHLCELLKTHKSGQCMHYVRKAVQTNPLIRHTIIRNVTNIDHHSQIIHAAWFGGNLCDLSANDRP